MKYYCVIVIGIFLAGIRDLKTISLNSTLAELGLDSMTTVGIKQALEREFEVYLTPQEIRNLTFSHLEELSASKQQTEQEEHPSEGAHLFVLRWKLYLEI
jgi:fatty acid synthase